MKTSIFAATLSLTALVLSAPSAFAQFVGIPVTGNFSLIGTERGNQYVGGKPTLLTPVGTINLTAADPNLVVVRGDVNGLITTNTPASAALGGLTGTASLNDTRTVTFKEETAVVKGFASYRSSNPRKEALAARKFDGLRVSTPTDYFSPVYLEPGDSFNFTITAGALYVPAASFSNYQTPQVQIPVTGGKFTITDPVGVQPATITIHSLLTPLGTTNITLTRPTLGTVLNDGRDREEAGPFVIYAESEFARKPAEAPTKATIFNLGGIADGTIAFSDGRTATVSNQFVSFNVQTSTSGFPASREDWLYVFDGTVLSSPVTIQGAITSGIISVPESAVTLPSQPVLPPITQPEQQYAIGLAASLNLGGEPEEYLKLVEQNPAPPVPEDLPDVEDSSLAFSRLHPAVNSYSK